MDKYQAVTPARRFRKRALSALLAAAMLLSFSPIFPPPIRAAADVGAAPTIIRQPSDGTFAKGAVLRLYVTALSATDSPLTYTWSAKGPGGSAVVAIPAADNGKAVLTTTAPSAAGVYTYQVTVAESDAAEAVSREAIIEVVDKALQPQLMNGDFETDATTSFPGTKLNKGIHNSNTTAAYWETTHEGTPDGRTDSTGKMLEIGKGSHYVMNDTTHTSRVAELSAFTSSTIYQEIATVPGKIYEWSIDHGARNNGVNKANPDVLAVVIGPAVNAQSDYADM
ncbi:MAG: hypothetical protein LBD49_00290, partial [Oscillospiraceae bacterium]|nr:hypothetical protein [Oscillospiraceae bacterium]